MKYTHIRKLFKRYRKGNASALESAKIESWYNALDRGSPSELSSTQLRALEENVFRFPDPSGSPRLRWPQLAASAVAVVALGVLLFVWLMDQGPSHGVIIETDYQPADGRIILSVDDRQYVLDPTQEGVQVKKDGISYLTQAEEEILNLSNTSLDGIRTYLDKSPPSRLSLKNVGGQIYKIRLSDGTLIWLNADSQIDYPEQFEAKERVVRLTGEAYFEVNPEKTSGTDRPFIVETGGQRITVLGTKFNVRAYEESANIATTLLEGRVSISSSRNPDVQQPLIPNQQSVYNKQTGSTRISDVDPQIATAWMDGLFSFESMALEDIMAEIKRWYHVDVIFRQETLRTEKFGGSIPRDASLSDVLKILTLTETVKFKIESKERRVLVMK